MMEVLELDVVVVTQQRVGTDWYIFVIRICHSCLFFLLFFKFIYSGGGQCLRLAPEVPALPRECLGSNLVTLAP